MGSAASELGYTGGLRLSEGMLHLQARVYWSRLRRFVQADNVDGRRYSYVAGDPVNARDPSGHKAVSWDLARDGSWTYRPSGGAGLGNCMDFGQCRMTVHWDLYASVNLGGGEDAALDARHDEELGSDLSSGQLSQQFGNNEGPLSPTQVSLHSDTLGFNGEKLTRKGADVQELLAGNSLVVQVLLGSMEESQEKGGAIHKRIRLNYT